MHELKYLDKDELLRGAELIGLKRKTLEKRSIEFIKAAILIKVVPQDGEEINIARAACKLYDLEFSEDEDLDSLKAKLYQETVRRQKEILEKMKPDKRKELEDLIIDSLDPKIVEKYAKGIKKLGARGRAAGIGILGIQAGSVALISSKLGLCMVATTSLSAISGLIGITFPFAAYKTAAVVAAWVIDIGAGLASGPAIAITVGAGAYLAYRKYRRKPLVRYIGLNYYCQAMKALKGIHEAKHKRRAFIERILWWRKTAAAST